MNLATANEARHAIRFIFRASLVTLAVLDFTPGNATETPQPSTVLRLIGSARYLPAEGKAWKAIRIGDMLDQGSVIETAKGSRLYISLGEKIKPLPSKTSENGGLLDPEIYPANLVRLGQGSILKLTKVTKRVSENRKEVSEHIELMLLTGTALGNVKKLSDGSSYEIMFSNCVARMRDAIYQVSAAGEVSVLRGAVSVSLTNGGPTKEVRATQIFLVSSGLITNMQPLSSNWSHDIWLPADPAYENWSSPRRIARPQ